MSIQARSTLGKLEKENDKDLRRLQYVTGQKAGPSRRALDTFALGVYEVAADIVEAGSDNNLVNLTAHAARAGDILRIDSTANNIQELEVSIDEIVSPNSLRLGAVLSANLVAGDTVTILRPITPRMGPTGATLATLDPAAIMFRKNGSLVEVLEDTATPANNEALPVKLMGVNGTLNLTANDLDISSSHTEDSIAIGDGTEILQINAAGEATVRDADSIAALQGISGKLVESVADATNSSSTPLGANITFTGAYFECLHHATLAIIIKADQAGTLTLDYSHDGVNVTAQEIIPMTPVSGKLYTFGCKSRYIRVSFTNGATAQTVFSLQSIFHKEAVKPSTHMANDVIVDADDCELMKSILTGKAPDDTYKNVQVTNGGNLKTALQEIDGVLKGSQVSASSLSVALSSEQQTILNDLLVELRLKADLTETQPVSAASLPLPAGAATEATLEAARVLLNNINSKDFATQTTLSNVDTDLGAPADAAVTNPALSASVIAALKGILTLIIDTNTKLDTIDVNSSPLLDSVGSGTATSGTITAPVGALRMVIQNSLASNSPIRFTKAAGGASASVGFYLGQGQSTSEIPAGSIDYFAVDGLTADVQVLWFV